MIEASSLDREQIQKKMKWGTLEYFWDVDAVKSIIITMIFLYALFGIVIFTVPVMRNILPSYAELLSVFVGITLGFYWNIADVQRKEDIDYRRMFRQFIEELNENMKKLKFLYSNRDTHNIAFLLKTNVWEISVERLNDINIKEMYDIGDIYHRLKIINIYIEKYPKTIDVTNYELDYIRKEKLALIEDIPEWIKTINSIYGWE